MQRLQRRLTPATPVNSAAAFLLQLEELKDDQVSIIKRNKWLEADRVEMSERFARSQDAQAVLRAAADKASAFAAATAEEALAAHALQQRERHGLLELLEQARMPPLRTCATCMHDMHALHSVVGRSCMST